MLQQRCEFKPWNTWLERWIRISLKDMKRLQLCINVDRGLVEEKISRNGQETINITVAENKQISAIKFILYNLGVY